MKNTFRSFLLAVVALVGALSSCQKEGFGAFSLSVKEVGADYVNIFVTAPEATEMAYILSDEPQLITPAVLFKTGTVRTVKPADLWKIDYGIFEGRKYYLYAAAKDGENGYASVELSFTTKEYDFSDLVSITRTYYNGFMAHITVPESVKEKGNVIRYGSTSLAWYNLLKSQKGGDMIDLNAIAANGDSFSGYVVNDSTIVMDDWNVVLLDEDRNPILDENGQQIDIHDPIAPNEPTVFLAGECKWGTPDEYADIMGFYKEQKRNAPNVPLYEHGKGWTGAFQKVEFFTKAPEQGEATVKVEIPEDEIGITDAMVYMTMEGNVDRYFYMILDNQTYNQILSIYLDNNEEWFQWFLTSYIAFYEWGVYPVSENLSINAASSFVEPLTGGETYHVLVNVFEKAAEGEQDFVTGSRQNFVHATFKAKEKTKPAPVIDVTKVETGSPYKVAFNIKAGKDSEGNVQPIMGAYWVCNYAREFELMFNLDYTYATLLKGNGNVFSAEDIAAINSEKGLVYEFDTLDGETSRMAVYGCNDEYTFNMIDETKYVAGWEDYAAPLADNADKIESDLYEKLAGEWTATATITAKAQRDDESIVSYDKTHSSKVVITYGPVELPEAVEADVYKLYDKTQKQVDDMYTDLKDLNQIFGESRVTGQNRLLCTGFIDFDYYNGDPYPNRMKYRSPYDLFKATDYSSIDVAQLIYDFGPKWFLEVQEDGSVIVPFHSVELPTLASWPGYPFYLGGYAEGTGAFMDSNKEHPGFPVEISEDYNTITIKPIVLTDGNKSVSYYLNALGVQAGSMGEVEIIAPVKSDLVLTRGWTEPAEGKAAVQAAPARTQLRNIDGSPVVLGTEKPVIKSYTRFSHEPRPEYRLEKNPNVITMDMFNETTEKALKRFNLK